MSVIDLKRIYRERMEAKRQAALQEAIEAAPKPKPPPHPMQVDASPIPKARPADNVVQWLRETGPKTAREIAEKFYPAEDEGDHFQYRSQNRAYERIRHLEYFGRIRYRDCGKCIRYEAMPDDLERRN